MYSYYMYKDTIQKPTKCVRIYSNLLHLHTIFPVDIKSAELNLTIYITKCDYLKGNSAYSPHQNQFINC